MKLELELWHLISLALAFFGASAGAAKMLLAQAQRHMDDRFRAQEAARAANHEQLTLRLDRLEVTAHEESGKWSKVERELLQMKADLPLNYVRREDYIRGQSVVEAKLDGLASLINNARLSALLDNRGKP